MPEGRKRKSPETYNLNRNILASIPKSPASGSKTIFWDKKTTGLGAYRTSRDRISFVFQYRSPIDNVTRRPTLGRLGQLTLEQARDMAADRAHDVRRGLDPVLEAHRKKEEQRRADEMVLAVYAEGYIQRRAAKSRPVPDRDITIIRNDVVRLLGDRRLDRITVEDVEKFGDQLRSRAPSAERTGLVQLKAILNEARKRGVIAASPGDGVTTPQSGERDRRFDDWEIQRYMEAAHDVGGPRGDVYALLMRLLKRKEEVSRMDWIELDVERCRWLLPAIRAKDRQDHMIALPRQAMEIILRQQPDPKLRTGPVFTLNGRTAPEMGSQVKDLLDANMHRRVEAANMRDGTARILSCEQMRSIASAARRCDHALGRVVELAVYNPVNAQALCHAPVELVGRLDYHVLDHVGRWNRVPIGAYARQAIRRSIGERSHGPLILDHHGQPLIVDRDAIDYAVQLVSEVDGSTSEYGWDLESLRLSGIFHLRAAGFSWPTIRRVAGEMMGGPDVLERAEPTIHRRVRAKSPHHFDPVRFIYAHEYVLSLEYVMNSRRMEAAIAVPQ